MKLFTRGCMQYKPERIAQRRVYIGFTQEKLAGMVHVPHQQISKYERGIIMPSAATLIALADALQCSTDYLLGRADKPDVGSDLDTIERDMITKFRAKQAKLSETLINKELANIADPTRDLIRRLVKFFLKNPGQVNDITDDS